MRKLIQGRLTVLKFDCFRKFKNITHFVTTREGWVSGNKPRFTGNDENEYLLFRKELANSGEWHGSKFVFPRQTHSDHVAVATPGEQFAAVPDTDALVTNEAGLFICVQTADCVPILMYDPVKNVVAAVHAGWRGTVSKILRKTVDEMVSKYNCNSIDIVAGIGPSIHMHAYEIGPEVAKAVVDEFSNSSALLKPSLRAGHAYFDLWEANKTLLLEAGLREENIEIMGLCSYEHPDLFYSARRDGADTGRMVSAIRIN